MGRPRNFESPDEIYSIFQEYKEDLKEQANEWLRVQYVGKEGDRVADAQKLPMTIEGFRRFCRNKDYGTINDYFANTNNKYEDFSTICSRITEEIRENQIIGGMLGFFNPSITQRLNGLADKQEVKTVKVGIDYEEAYE